MLGLQFVNMLLGNPSWLFVSASSVLITAKLNGSYGTHNYVIMEIEQEAFSRTMLISYVLFAFNTY